MKNLTDAMKINPISLKSIAFYKNLTDLADSIKIKLIQYKSYRFHANLMDSMYNI